MGLPAILEPALVGFDCEAAVYSEFWHEGDLLSLELELLPQGLLVSPLLALQIAQNDLLIVGALFVGVGGDAVGTIEGLLLAVLDELQPNWPDLSVLQLDFPLKQLVQDRHLVQRLVVPTIRLQTPLLQTAFPHLPLALLLRTALRPRTRRTRTLLLLEL